MLRFEIGRKLSRSSVDRDGFSRKGWTRAGLNDDGKIPSEKDRLTRFVMIGMCWQGKMHLGTLEVR